ncbi:MAG: hypothetical protein ABSH39_09685 [Candidatus Acidiferrum sp.]
MFAVHDDVGHGCPQNERDQLRQFAIAKHSSTAKLFYVDLLENFAGRSKRFYKHSLVIGDRIRHGMKIFKRQRQIFRKRAVVRENAENCPSRAMRLQTALAKIT